MSTVTHRTPTAALSGDQELPSQQSSPGCSHRSPPTTSNQLISLLQKTLRGSRERDGEEIKKAIDRTGYSGTKQNIQPAGLSEMV